MYDEEDKVSDLPVMDNSPSLPQRDFITGAVGGRSDSRHKNMMIRAKKNQSIESKRQKSIREVSRKIRSIVRAPLAIFSPDRDKATPSENPQDRQYDEEKEFYLAPTILHKACLFASCLEDFRDQIASSYSSDASIAVDMRKKDCNGRNPIHLLALNKKMACSLVKDEQDEDYKDGHGNLDVSKAARISDFILKLLLPKHPSSLLDKDKNGLLPFEEIILHWIESAHIVDQQLLSSHKSSLPNRFFRRVSHQENENVQSNSEGFLSSIPFAGQCRNNLDFAPPSTTTSDTEDYNISSSSSSERRAHTSPRPDRADLVQEDDVIYLPTNLDQSSELMRNWSNCDQGTHHTCPSTVQATIHVKYALYLLSAIVDYLDKEAMAENSKQSLLNQDSKQSVLTHSRTSSTKSMNGRSFFQETTSFPLENCMNGAENFLDESPSFFHIRSSFLTKFASTPEIIKTLLLISDVGEKDIIFQYSVVRNIILSKESIGKWITSMLQSPQRKVAYHAVEYFQMMSDVLKERTKIWQHVDSEGIDKRTKELYDELRYLDDLIPSMLGLDEKMVEKAATTPVISRVLDRIITAPFAACSIFFDVVLLAILITTFRMSATGFLLRKESKNIIIWIYVANSIAFYFVIRELGKGVALQAITTRRLFWTNLFFNVWQLVNMFAIIMTITSTVVMRLKLKDFDLTDPDSHRVQTLLAMTTALLWLKLLGMMKTINRKLATFILAIVEITRDIIWYIIILLIFVVCFAQIFYTLLVPDDCNDKSSETDSNLTAGNVTAGYNDKSSEIDCNPNEYVFKVYTILLGDFGMFEREEFDTRLLVSIFMFFSMVVVIVLMNVLIAIISDSYEKCTVRSKGLFGRTRVLLIAEIVSFQGLFINLKRDDTANGVRKMGCIRWTRSFTFIFLATLVVLIWIFAEMILYQSEVEYGRFLISLLSIFVNVAVLTIIMIALSRRHRNKSLSQVELYTPIQRVMLRLLGTTEHSAGHGAEEVDEWGGRAVFLQKEMSRTTAEASKHTRDFIETELATSNRRMRRRILFLENQLLKSEERMCDQVLASEERTHQMIKEYMRELGQNVN